MLLVLAMLLREATVWDVMPAMKLGERYVVEAGAYIDIPYDPELAAGRMIEAIRDDDQLFIVVLRHGEVVGLLWAAYGPFLIWSPECIATDIVVYVMPEYRGTKGSLGLIKAYREWAEDKGAKEVRLSVASGIHEEKTGKLYNKLGFEHLGSQYRRKL